MELYTTPTATATATILSIPKIFPAKSPAFLRYNHSLALKQSRCSRSLSFTRLVRRANYSDDTSNGTNLYAGEEDRSAVVTVEHSPAVETNKPNDEAPREEVPLNDDQATDFLANLSIKFDPEDSYSILLYGGGALTVLWLASAVVSAIDSIPLFPKLMEVVGLGYSFWFTTRYLLFKKNRDELVTKVEGLKQQILGSNDD